MQDLGQNNLETPGSLSLSQRSSHKSTRTRQQHCEIATLQDCSISTTLHRIAAGQTIGMAKCEWQLINLLIFN